MMTETPEPKRRSFLHISVGRPVGALVILITLVILGLISYSRIPLQMLPSGVGGSRFTVMVQHPGSSAQENDDKVARILEEQFRTLPDIDDVWSRSGDGSCRVRVTFSSKGNLDLAKAELRDRIERARPILPDTVQRIFVWANDDGDLPIMWLAILADDEVENADFLIESRIQRRLEAVDGVSKVNVFGLLDDSIRILLDEEKVAAANLNIGNLIQRLSADNFSKPLGEVSDGGRRFLLRSDMRFESLDEVEDYPVGGGLRLSDLASIERIKTVRDRLTRINGRLAYYCMVQKESDANVVEVGDLLEQAIADFDKDPALRGRFGTEVFFNKANFIRTSLGTLQNTAIWGGGLAVLILFIFLKRFRMTLCVALSIPVSVLLALTWEYFSGGSFNVLTMTGLTLALGMLVDNSVVVIENIARMRAKGMDRRSAAIEGTRDVGLAIALATLTTVVVFLPLIFMIRNQQIRVFLSAMGMPLCMALLFSLLVALVFLPVISAAILGDRPRWLETLARRSNPLMGILVRPLAWIVGALARTFDIFIQFLSRLEYVLLRVISPLRLPLAVALVARMYYRVQGAEAKVAQSEALMELGMQRPLLTQQSLLLTEGLGLVVGMLLLFFVVPAWRKRVGRLPAWPSKRTPQGLSVLSWVESGNSWLLGWTLKHRVMASALALLAIASGAIPQRSIKVTAFGRDGDTSQIEIDVELEDNFTLREASQEMQQYEDFLEPLREEYGFANLIVRFSSGGGEVSMRWKEAQDPGHLDSLRASLRENLPRYPGHELHFGGDQALGAASKQGVQFQIRGTDAKELERLGAEAIAILSRVPGLLEVRSPLEEAPEQIRLAFDREAAFALGVSSQAALRNVSWALRGAQLARFQEAGREVPFIIEYDSEELAGLDTLRDLSISTVDGAVALSAFADIRFQRGRRSIWRWNGKTTFSVQALIVNPTRQVELVTAGYDALEAELNLPRGFSLGREESVAQQQLEEVTDMKHAMALSIVLVFLLMGVLFESLVLPFSVLATIPFACVGAFWTLFLTDTSMDSFGYIGIIILVGVVVNNGIVLVDKIHRLRVDDGLERSAAVQAGAVARVRPILMTAMTTVFGLLPMVLGEAGRDGIDYRALATCVAGGLTISTFFTLWVVPLAYTLMDDLGIALRDAFKHAFGLKSKQPRQAVAPITTRTEGLALRDSAE